MIIRQARKASWQVYSTRPYTFMKSIRQLGRALPMPGLIRLRAALADE